MNLFYDIFPTSVIIGNTGYPIDSDFCISIQFEELIQSDEIKEEEKIMKALALYYPKIPDDLTEAVNQMLWFYQCGNVADLMHHGKSSSQMIYSYEYDAKYIYAAFLDQYAACLGNQSVINAVTGAVVAKGAAVDVTTGKVTLATAAQYVLECGDKCKPDWISDYSGYRITFGYFFS